MRLFNSNNHAWRLRLAIAAGVLAGCTAAVQAADSERPAREKPASIFAKPELLRAGGEPIRVESPGFASPSWSDMNGDGRPDLLVGQFSGGKIKVYANEGDGKFASGTWLKTNDKEVAKVPGVW